mgnify:FL=1
MILESKLKNKNKSGESLSAFFFNVSKGLGDLRIEAKEYLIKKSLQYI